MPIYYESENGDIIKLSRVISTSMDTFGRDRRFVQMQNGGKVILNGKDGEKFFEIFKQHVKDAEEVTWVDDSEG